MLLAAKLVGILPAVAAVYYLTTLMIWIGHYLPHRPDSRLRHFHMGGHHRHYPDSKHARSRHFIYGHGRNDSLVPQLPWLIGLAVLLWAALPEIMASFAVAEVVLLAAANSYVHMHFHLDESWLARYAWFRRAQAAHDVHHDQDVNFMVADHFWDRRFGTYRRPE